MLDAPTTSVSHPAGMRRMDFQIWVTDEDLDYITGALVEREQTWESFVKQALLLHAAR